ncbi:MAG: hypothetical protein P4L22_05460 [Candidatus Babeliales bacterium]|nr:hypothetical protein [Candidatus Babeliales bacterium]
MFKKFLISLFLFNSINGVSVPLAVSQARINDLANWFSTGMENYEKEYEKDHPTKKTPLPNSFTQSEADMKYISNYNKQGSFKTVQQLRKNEDKLIAWILKKFPQTPNVNLKFVKKILNKERDHSNDYVFYHAHNIQYGLIFDLYREIENFLEHASSIFNSEPYDKNKFSSTKVQLRQTSAIQFPFKNIDGFINHWDNYYAKQNTNYWNDDGEPKLRSNMISTNVGLFGNLENFGECTFYYFLASMSIASSHGLLDNIFKNWKFNPKYKKELEILYENFMKSDTGHLLQIFIPANSVNKYAFASHAFGTPYKTKLTNSFKPKTINGINFSRHTDIKSILDLYKSGKFPVPAFDSLQARVVSMPEFFAPNNGIKIFRYTTSGIELEYGGDYKKGLRAIVARMMISNILQKQAAIQKNNDDLQLKQVFYDIAEWSDLASPAEKNYFAKEKIANTNKLEAKSKAEKEKDAKDKLAELKAVKENAAKLAKDKASKQKANKAKALLALQAKQFKTTSDMLTKQANIIWQFKVAKASKKALLVKKLAPQVNKLKKDLVTVPVNIKNAQGQTPLMLDPRRAPIVYGLEKKKAKITVNAKDAKGKTVLQYLIQSPYFANVNLYRALINAGAKVTDNDIKVAQNKLKNKPKVKTEVIKILKVGKKNK